MTVLLALWYLGVLVLASKTKSKHRRLVQMRPMGAYEFFSGSAVKFSNGY